MYIANDNPSQENIPSTISAFDQLNLFDNSNDIMKRIVNNCFFFKYI